MSGFPKELKKRTDFERGAQKKNKTETRRTMERKTGPTLRTARIPWRKTANLGPEREPKNANSASSSEGRG
ncbi:hypothetical protein NDU88_003314 [Pleurodeles waltl]|uniref:Uncharacterized protein n=1 Tax=Pleurodeles waltl TaxID=8319 RepID=A0AAV7SED8_PLEWA|nr:hypothetical protein NDU88_003314 [Pleurodeles waltl]